MTAEDKNWRKNLRKAKRAICETENITDEREEMWAKHKFWMNWTIGEVYFRGNLVAEMKENKDGREKWNMVFTEAGSKYEQAHRQLMQYRG